METLRPVEVSEYYISRVAAGMKRYFWDNIFKHIFEILKDNTVNNSKDDVINALKSGKIWYENGAFRGKFNNAISSSLEKAGAKFRHGAYYIELSSLPYEYTQVIAFVKAQALTKANNLLEYLSGLGVILPQLQLKDYIEPIVQGMYKNLELELIKSAQEKQVPVIELGIVKPQITLPKVERKKIDTYWKEYDKKAEQLQKEILKSEKKGEDTSKLKQDLKDLNKDTFQNAPQLDLDIDSIELDEQSKKIAQDYTYNMQYWVKKWEVKDIVKMRQDVIKMIQEGARVPRLTEYFEKRWGIAKSKANFLAVNESHLAGSVIKATQYQMMGCNSFKWGRSSSKEKRELHKLYYDKVFSFDNPPVIDEELGIKGLPRQIWNCKCHMLVVVPALSDIIKKRTEIQNAKRNIFTKIKNSKQCDNNAWRYRRFGEGQTL